MSSTTVTDAQFDVLKEELGRDPSPHCFDDEGWTMARVAYGDPPPSRLRFSAATGRLVNLTRPSMMPPVARTCGRRDTPPTIRVKGGFHRRTVRVGLIRIRRETRGAGWVRLMPVSSSRQSTCARGSPTPRSHRHRSRDERQGVSAGAVWLRG